MNERTSSVLVEGRYFCEGPRWHEDRFWFSDFYAHEVCSVDLAGDVRVEVAMPDDERSSGLGWLPDGRLLLVAMLARAVWRREDDGSLVPHADLSGIASFHTNDMLVDADGTAFVGNFGFDLDARLAELGVEGLLGAIASDPTPYLADLARIAPDGTVSVAATGLRFPNGVVRLGDTLVVAETLGFELAAFDIGPDGGLGDRRTWAQLVGGDGAPVAPDGIAADERGGVWVANALAPEVRRVEEGGEVTDVVTTTQPAFACALGGPDGRHLLVCTAPDSSADGAAAAPRARLEIVEL